MMTSGTLSTFDEPKPNSYRTPGYALFSAGVFSTVGIKLWAIMLIQCFIDTCTAVLIFLSIRLLVSTPTALIVALLYALDPFPAIYSLMMMSETLSLFFLCTGLWALLKYFADTINMNARKYLVFAAVMFAVSHLVRPILPFLPFVVSAVMFLSRKYSTTVWYKNAMIFAFAFWLTLSPWYARNYIQFNRFSMSSGADHALLILRVKPMLMAKWSTDKDITETILVNMADSLAKLDGKSIWTSDGFENGVYFRKIAMYFIYQNPELFIKDYITGTIRCFAVLPVKDLQVFTGDVRKPNPAELNYAAKGLLTEISKYFQKQTGWFLFTAIYCILLYLGTYLLVGTGVLSILRKLNPSLVFCLIMTILLTVLTAFGTTGRFRLPIMIFYLPLAAEGISFLVRKRRPLATTPIEQTR